MNCCDQLAALLQSVKKHRVRQSKQLQLHAYANQPPVIIMHAIGTANPNRANFWGELDGRQLNHERNQAVEEISSRKTQLSVLLLMEESTCMGFAHLQRSQAAHHRRCCFFGQTQASAVVSAIAAAYP